ncbi:dihydrodipicolinate synthase/N-acetylneuraminate lyase [Candidatus Scalindua japonica]|uniref:Dihydrodipicolinate synthase/N-acetylneuraminate lyase n=1 Tax=Candidatus Scalindua japonica TaxID=1284222 RepID=A0A286TXD8_9BACT|nr:dihydrodipicolinate synthase/N-acetylneuraminate lyase [Candidatus Scalindua japonica]
MDAATVSGNDNDTDFTTSIIQRPTIFFRNPDFNFGQIYTGQKVEHIYKFENRGEDILEIKKVKASCGCTAVVLSDNTIPSGGTGEIKTTFSSGSLIGNITKSITVSSNDPGTPKYRLTISGEIIKDLIINPEHIDFGSVSKDEEAIKTVTIKSQTEHDFKINKITPSKPFINASITEVKNGEYVIKVTLKYRPEIGRISGGIHLETNSKIQKKVNIPFFGEIAGDITTYPKKIYYGPVTKGKELTHKLYVKINKSNIEILKIKTFPDYISTEIVEKKEGKDPHYLIEVKLHSDAAIGNIGGVLELHTNSETQPVTLVRIIGEVE